jgi:uncharacterized protein (TIGR02145 family)
MKTKTYSTISISIVLLFSFLLVTLQACKKDDNPNQPPVCEITAPVNGQEITKGDTVTISVNATDDDGSIVEVRFFIDGVGKSSVSSFPYNYQWYTDTESTGNHTIKATSIDNDGGSTSDEISLIIEEGRPPIADFTASITSGSAPLTIHFTDQSVNNPTNWIWGFSDGVTSNQQNPTHTFNNDGSYTVTLTVSNEFGSDTRSKINYIYIGGSGSTFSDPRDGQSYKIVTIGSQTWFAENLKYLPSVGPSADGANFSAFYYYVYGYEGTNVSEAKATTNFQTYGVLYNWLAATSACPDGWHLPTDDEWKILEMYLGMSQSDADAWGWRGIDEGKKLKNTNGWYDNGNGTNESGFSALPGGYRIHIADSSGFFSNLEQYGGWWTSTPVYNARANRRSLYYERDEIDRDSFYKGAGMSVRCLKD